MHNHCILPVPTYGAKNLENNKDTQKEAKGHPVCNEMKMIDVTLREGSQQSGSETKRGSRVLANILGKATS